MCLMLFIKVSFNEKKKKKKRNGHSEIGHLDFCLYFYCSFLKKSIVLNNSMGL